MKMRTTSTSYAIPLMDGEYIGRWIGYVVIVQFDGYDVRMDVKDKSLVHDALVNVMVSEGKAIVVVADGRH